MNFMEAPLTWFEATVYFLALIVCIYMRTKPK